MLGKVISPTLFLKLKEFKPRVVVLLDPDAYKNSLELYYQLYSIYLDCEDCVKIVKLPDNDDIDELRKNKGIDAVIETLYTARSLTTDDYFVNKLRKPYEYFGKRDSSKNY
jgi:DNA primase